MSQTQRCIVCSLALIDKPLWEDEVCACCGRCAEHCTAPHELAFDPAAHTDEGRPHPDAGKKVQRAAFTPGKEDKDRARAPV